MMQRRSLEEFIEEVNGNGRYQSLLVFLALGVAIPVAFMQNASVFIGEFYEQSASVESYKEVIIKGWEDL